MAFNLPGPCTAEECYHFLVSLDVHCWQGRQPELPGSGRGEGFGKGGWGAFTMRIRDGWVGRIGGAGGVINAVMNVMGREKEPHELDCLSQ